MPITNPTQLVDEFKKSGEFDRLRRELLAQFRSSENYTSFMDRVEDVARQRLASDNKVKTLPETSMVKELMQHLNRYPIVERAVSDMEESTLSNPAYKSNIANRIARILREDHTGKPEEQASSNGHPALVVYTGAHLPDSEQGHTTTQNGSNSHSSIDQNGSKTELADGNESEDSAMLESPVSDKDEDKPFA